MRVNRVVIAGYVSKKPELRYFPSGTPVANVPGGRERPIRRGQRGNTELTNWHSLFYRKLADVPQPLKKGNNVYVGGRIEQRQVIAREGSKPRTVLEIVVSQCHVIAPARRGNKAAESGVGRNAANGSRIVGSGGENDWPIAG